MFLFYVFSGHADTFKLNGKYRWPGAIDKVIKFKRFEAET